MIGSALETIATPALVCDLDVADANLTLAASLALEAGVSLRPHAKSHKSAFFARSQLDLGAVGICVAKLSEAVAIGAQMDTAVDILVTSPLGTEAAARKLAHVGKHSGHRLSVVVDCAAGVGELERAARAVGVELRVLVDLDIGTHRTGATSPRAAGELCWRVADSSHLRFGGLQAYGGHLQHLGTAHERADATAKATGHVRAVLDELGDLDVPTISGGGTGTFGTDLALGTFSELQLGSYLFMDREYLDVGLDEAFAPSLFVRTTVISANHDGHVTVDAGLKAMATDAGAARVVGEGEHRYAFFGDEHGLVTTRETPLLRGDQLMIIPAHCDPTVDRYDYCYGVRSGIVTNIITIDARGCSQS